MSSAPARPGTLTIAGHEDAPNLDGGYFQGMYDDFTLTPR